MAEQKSYSDIIAALEAYSTDIASWRIELIEREMRRDPDKNPEFAQSLKDIETERLSLIQKLNGDYEQLEPLIKAYLAYHSELIYEVYKQAVLDGGRVFQAFIERELPRKEHELPVKEHELPRKEQTE